MARDAYNRPEGAARVPHVPPVAPQPCRHARARGYRIRHGLPTGRRSTSRSTRVATGQSPEGLPEMRSSSGIR